MLFTTMVNVTYLAIAMVQKKNIYFWLVYLGNPDIPEQFS